AKNGTQVAISLAPSVVRDAKGKPIMLLAVMRDITERKRIEQEIQDKNEQLDAQNEELRATEEEVRSSNEELEAANEELREAQEQMVRSERLAAIGQLAGGVGHELRNPLGAIKNAVYYIKGKVNGSELAQREPRVVEFLEIVDDEVNSSEKIINDLLGFSRVGKPAVSSAMIDRVVEDAVAHTHIPENIELTKNVNGNLPEIEIDTEQIRQVLVNMITNAVQAMPGGGKLTIEGRQQDSFIELDIADTGGGISAKDIDKIFDPLFTLKAKGIGLGLAVCKTIIERHAGHIEVKSSQNRGTTFTIKLPLKAK
ncbi:nitrogen regulation protein NR(II), partial [Chloroflexota bacterium]